MSALTTKNLLNNPISLTNHKQLYNTKDQFKKKVQYLQITLNSLTAADKADILSNSHY